MEWIILVKEKDMIMTFSAFSYNFIRKASVKKNSGIFEFSVILVLFFKKILRFYLKYLIN